MLKRRDKNGPASGVPGGLDVWQAKDLRKCDFGSVAIAGLRSETLDLWQMKELGRKRLKVCRFEG
jgi:hypothetical protein